MILRLVDLPSVLHNPRTLSYRQAFVSVSLTAHTCGSYPLILKYLAHTLRFSLVVLWMVPRPCSR